MKYRIIKKPSLREGFSFYVQSRYFWVWFIWRGYYGPREYISYGDARIALEKLIKYRTKKAEVVWRAEG